MVNKSTYHVKKGGNFVFYYKKFKQLNANEGDLGIFFENHCESHRSAHRRNTCYVISFVCTLIYHKNEPISARYFTQLL